MKIKFQVLVMLALPSLLSYAQGGRNFDTSGEVKKVQGNIYMLGCAGGKHHGASGARRASCLWTHSSRRWLEDHSRRPQTFPTSLSRYIINTHVHSDHSGGNEALAKPDSAKIVAHENVFKR